MSYSSFLKPRPETISEEGIEGIIDLANLSDKTQRKLEARPKDFLNLTYPTSDVIKVLEQIHQRFSSLKHVAGLFLFEGLKGSGKSHLLLMLYHLFKNPDIGREWVKENGVEWKVPENAVVVINKFTDAPYDSIWGMIFEALGAPPYKGKTHPKLSDFQKALGDREVILIFDELEQGIKVINDPALQAQNIAFLQMLSELSNRSKQVTLFASIYTDRDEPGNTLKRVPRCVVQFENTRDKNNIILHRLFENYKTFDKKGITPIVESYLQLWLKQLSFDQEDLRQRFSDTYPFTPSLVDIILKKIPARGGFQNVRGALSFLGNLVRLTHATNDIITPADVSLEDKATSIMLRDLDPSGDLIERAKENMAELIPKAPLAKKIAPAALLYTLTGTGGSMGVSREQLIFDIISPSADINAFGQTLMAFHKYASHFHHQEGRYYFDLEENSEAKVEFRSLNYSDDQAREKLHEILISEIFRESENVAVFITIERVKELLEQFDKLRPRYVLTGRRLTQEERHALYFGLNNRNLVLLLEPRDDTFQLAGDKDLLKWAKRYLAAKDLMGGTKKSSRQAEYERITRSDQGHIIDKIKKAGLVFVRWVTYGNSVSEDQIELEPLPGDFSKDRVLEKLNQDYFPMLSFKEHLEGRLEHIRNRMVKEIDAEYRATLGFPVPVNVRVVSSAIRELCRGGIVGIQHSSGNFCHVSPALTETELFNAKVTPPLEEGPVQPLCPRCGKRSCECLPPGTQKCPTCGQYPCVCALPVDACPHCGKTPCICPKKEIISLRIPPQTTSGSLRQESAFRLQQYEGGIITRASYTIFFQKSNIGDLSLLPSGIRGNLSGQGDVTAEISIIKAGKFSKSQIEQQIESLPALPDADYSADLTIELPG